MANNRLFIKCKCGDMLYIGRHFQDGWWIPPHIKDGHREFAEVLNEFYTKHFDCFFEYGENHLSITTENDEYDEEQGQI